MPFDRIEKISSFLKFFAKVEEKEFVFQTVFSIMLRRRNRAFWQMREQSIGNFFSSGGLVLPVIVFDRVGHHSLALI